MNLYHDNFRGRLRWYVKVSKTGRRIDIAEEYSTAWAKRLPQGLGGGGPCLGRSATHAPHQARRGASHHAPLLDQ